MIDEMTQTDPEDPRICKNCGEDIGESFCTPDGNHFFEDDIEAHIAKHGSYCPECLEFGELQ